VYPRPLEGDVAEAAAEVIASGAAKGTTLFGGETTVQITGTGLGGRNQELALRVALGAGAAGWTGPWVFLSGGTDGRDGPTDAAGGLVDHTTLSRMKAAGINPAAILDDNDSYHALKAVGDLLLTGATGTNVADLQVLIRG
jgi:hydroxypyruvate reductase